MSRAIHRLTVLQVNKAARKGLTLCDGGNLYLQDGSSWIFRYARQGQPRWMGLGPLLLVDLPAAREAAQTCRKQLFAGIDPLDHRKAQRAAQALAESASITFDACVAAYISAHGDGWRSAIHRRAWEKSLRIHASPILGKMSVAAIDTSAVLRVLEPIWKEKTVTASRLRERIERVLSWAGVKGYRDNDIPNPARWKGHLDQLLAAKSAISKVAHFAALPYGELPAFMAQLRKEQGPGARALEFLILCTVRTGDVIGSSPMLWSHLDLDARLWTIPQTKNGSEHSVPLSDSALAVLDQMKPLRDSSDVVFAGNEKIMLRTLKQMGHDVTTHGFRSAFKTWASECTNHEKNVIEASLAHAKGKLDAAYHRGSFLDKRRKIMVAWADFCDGRTVPHEDATNVVTLRG